MSLKDFALGGSVLVSEKAQPKFVLLERIIDFSVSANSVSAGDTCQCLNVPAGFLALGAGIEVLTVESTTAAFGNKVSLGDGDDADGYITTAMGVLTTAANVLSTAGGNSLASLGGTCTWTNAYGPAGKFYAAADTVDLFAYGTINGAKVRVGVWGFMFDSGVGTAFGLDGDSA
jgi:hypothetical protein